MIFQFCEILLDIKNSSFPLPEKRNIHTLRKSMRERYADTSTLEK